LAEQLRGRVSGAEVKLHAPHGKGKVWWIDVMHCGHFVVIEWSKEEGFGLSTPSEDDYGSAANEVYADADEAASRMVQFLVGGEKARARHEMHPQAFADSMTGKEQAALEPRRLR